VRGHARGSCRVGLGDSPPIASVAADRAAAGLCSWAACLASPRVGLRSSGKSQFACYLLRRLHEDHPAANLLLVDHKRPPLRSAILFPGAAAAAVQMGSSTSEMFVASAMDDPNGFVILDQGSSSHAPGRCYAKTVVLSSLDSKHFKDFRNAYHAQAIMTCWSRKEMQEAYALLYHDAAPALAVAGAAPPAAAGLMPTSALADWEARFDKLGGVPRWVFDKSRSAALVVSAFLDEMPSADEIRVLLLTKSAGAISVGKGSRLVTFEVDLAFQQVAWRWVSDFVGSVALRTLKSHSESSAAELLFQISNSDERSAFGAAFESWAHLQLAKGGTFRVKPISAAAEAPLRMPSTETVWYANDKEGDVADQVSASAPLCWFQMSDAGVPA
jgi:hypothetical protein